jgi:chromosome segregation ATPase
MKHLLAIFLLTGLHLHGNEFESWQRTNGILGISNAFRRNSSEVNYFVTRYTNGPTNGHNLGLNYNVLTRATSEITAYIDGVDRKISSLESEASRLQAQDTTLILRVSALEQASLRITTLEKELAASKAREQTLDARLKEAISAMERMEKRMEELENRQRPTSSGPARRSRSIERKERTT